MENPKRIVFPRGRAALLATACLITPLHAAEKPASPKLSNLPVSKPANSNVSLVEAQELLHNGDQAYHAGRYGDAVQAYSGATEMIPASGATAELHAAAADRYAQASVEYAKDLSRKGDIAGAKSAIDRVLAPDIAPAHPGAIAFRAELDDPIRTNPALTASHGQNVDAVRRLLYTADGAYQLGNFDLAKNRYEDVLRIDPTNTAARRGMERVASAKSDYQKSAYDHTRAELLSQTDAQWELKVNPEPLEPTLSDPGATLTSSTFVPVANKLDRIIIPSVNLQQTTLQEALDFLRVRARENDNTELDPDRRGVNITLNLGDPTSEAAQTIQDQRFDLQLSNVPLSQVLKYITEITRTIIITDDYAVTIRPVGSATESMVTRTYKVPPDFLSSLGSGPADSTNDDPFASPNPSSNGLLPQRLGAQEAFVQKGIPFPEGARAVFNAATNSLQVTNTPAAHDVISQIVETIGQQEPVMIAVRVTMIKAEQTVLKELGVDWLLDEFNVNGEKLVLSGGTQGSGGDLSDIATTDGNPITAGNRSGQGAISGNSIDSVLGYQRPSQGNLRAPGAFQVNGELGSAQVSALFRTLDQKKGVDLMVNPSTVTRSGQASSIKILREFIYPTEYEPPELPDTIGSVTTVVLVDGVPVEEYTEGPDYVPVTPATPTSFEMKEVGVSLDVLPTADAKKQFVDLTINPSIVDFDGFINYGSPIIAIDPNLIGSQTFEVTPNAILMPVFSAQRASTSLTIADGSTVVIGGLLQNSVQNVEDKTPILGDLPIVGRLFQSNALQTTKTAIIFLVKVQLMDPTGRLYKDR
jgi:general secretion pathway protein D